MKTRQSGKRKRPPRAAAVATTENVVPPKKSLKKSNGAAKSKSALRSTSKAGRSAGRKKRAIGDDAAEFIHCKHNTFDVHNVVTKINKPEAWLCSTCDVSHDVWVCLTCGSTGCGRETGAHAFKHYEDYKHPISLHLNKKHCYCYACEEYVVLDNKNSELELIRHLIDDVQSQESSASYTRSGKTIRSKQDFWKLKGASRRRSFMSNSSVVKQRLRDKLFTATMQYHLQLQRKYLDAWSSLVRKRQKETKLSAKKRVQIEGSKRRSSGAIMPPTSPSSAAETSGSSDASLEPVLRRDSHSMDPRLGSALQSPSPGSYRESQQQLNSTYLSKGRSGRRKKLLLPGRVGMTNLGNTCYINSVLQALSNTRMFWKYFIRFRHAAPPESDEDDLESQSSNDEEPAKKTKRGATRKQSSGKDPIRSTSSGSSIEANTALFKTPLGAPTLRRLSSEIILEKVESKENKKTKNPLSLCLEIHNLLRVLWSGKWGVVTPHALVFAIWRFIPGFRSFRQQDAHEFFDLFTDQVLRELTNQIQRRLDFAEKIELDGCIYSPSVSIDYTSHTAVAEQSKLFVENAFTGTMLQIIECDVCKSRSTRKTEFKSLQVHIPVELQKAPVKSRRCGKSGGCSSAGAGPCSLHNCIEEMIKPVTLSGDSQYECDHCGKKTDAKKTERIGHLPDILVVHINRSRWDLRGTRCKLTDHVSFPLKNLDLKYATWDGDAVIADGGRTNYIYNLSAVVSHHGKGLDNGHYTALCLDADSNNWIHFNDRKVTISSEQDVQRTEGYLLFYEKTKSVP